MMFKNAITDYYLLLNDSSNYVIVIDCLEYDKDSPGNDVGFLFASSIEACHKKCQEESKCNFFMFKQNRLLFQNGCWLKSKKLSSLPTNVGFILGPKYCGKII